MFVFVLCAVVVVACVFTTCLFVIGVSVVVCFCVFIVFCMNVFVALGCFSSLSISVDRVCCSGLRLVCCSCVKNVLFVFLCGVCFVRYRYYCPCLFLVFCFKKCFVCVYVLLCI